MDDDTDDRGSLWGVPLNEPATAPDPTPTPRSTSDASDADDTFLLRGDDPPSDGVYRPRLRGFGDTA